MRKEMYLVRGNKQESYGDFKARVLSLAKSIVNESKPSKLSLTVTEAPPPAISIIPFKKTKLSIISVYKEPAMPEESLVRADGFAGAYFVDEAIPVSYERTWPSGTPSPGACLVTLFHRKPGIDQVTFLDRWHNSHTPLTLKIHPLYSYNRNVVLGKVADHPAWYDGIVEEQTRTRSELLNPFKFFGKPSKVVQNMLAVYTDTRSFLDYKRIETYLAREYQLL